jgi:sugar-specific transcriptional regulator TrmB
MDKTLTEKQLSYLGLKDTEMKIILSVSKMGKPIAMISRHTSIPRTSIHYMIKKLKEKSYVFPVKIGKRIYWRSNMPKIVRHLNNLNKLHT